MVRLSDGFGEVLLQPISWRFKALDSRTYPMQNVEDVKNSCRERVFWRQAILRTNNDKVVLEYNCLVRLAIIAAIADAKPAAVKGDEQRQTIAGSFFFRERVDMDWDRAAVAQRNFHVSFCHTSGRATMSFAGLGLGCICDMVQSYYVDIGGKQW